MRVLWLCSGADQHAHDYADWLFHGFVELLGYENVRDYPEKACLHLAPDEPRDECNIDSDQRWPKRGAMAADEAARWADLAIICCQVDNVASLAQIAVLCRSLPESTPIACVDMTDHVRDLREFYEDVAGRSLAGRYFKRELPIGADWGHPCPMTYPASRIPDPMPEKVPRVYYHATHHGGGAPGIPRIRIVRDLREALPATLLDVALYPSQQNRPSPEEYHAAMARALVGVSWNGAANYDCNRLWENFAFGLCQVAEEPRIQIPNAPVHLRHCLYVKRPEEVAPAVKMLIDQPRWAFSLAAAGHEHFKRYHSSRARAAYVLERLGYSIKEAA